MKTPPAPGDPERMLMPAPVRVVGVVPCHNEEAAIAKVVTDLRATVPGIEVHVYDNCSTDDTAGAARVVLNGAELGRAVEALLAPDRVALMAHAGWDVATRGAEVTNRIVDLIHEAVSRAATPAHESASPPVLAAEA